MASKTKTKSKSKRKAAAKPAAKPASGRGRGRPRKGDAAKGGQGSLLPAAAGGTERDIDDVLAERVDGPSMHVPRVLVHAARVCSDNPEIPAHCGVNVRRTKAGRVVAYATDGIVALKVMLSADLIDKTEFAPLTIKASDWRTGLQYLTSNKEDQEAHPSVTLCAGRRRPEIINACSETTSLTVVEPITAEFPDVERQIPQGGGEGVLVNPRRLAGLLTTLGKLCKGEPVRISVADDGKRLILSGECGEDGEAVAVMDLARVADEKADEGEERTPKRGRRQAHELTKGQKRVVLQRFTELKALHDEEEAYRMVSREEGVDENTVRLIVIQHKTGADTQDGVGGDESEEPTGEGAEDYDAEGAEYDDDEAEQDSAA